MVSIDTLTLGYTIAGILVFLLWYTLLSSRLLGRIVSLILRLVLGDKVVLDIQGIHIALLTGRIYFRRLTYVTPNAALSVLDGVVRIFWWRSVLVFGTPSEVPSNLENQHCLVSISLNGLEYTIANNSNRREQIEKILSMRNGKHTQVAVEDASVAATLPFLFKMSPKVRVCVHRGVVCIGNDISLPETALVVAFDSAKAVIHTKEPSLDEYVYGLLVSAWLFKLTVREQPPMTFVPVPKAKKEPPVAPRRVAPADVFSPSFKSTQLRDAQDSDAQPTARSGRALALSFLDVDRVLNFGRNIKHLGSQAIEILEGAGAKLKKLDEHLLSLPNHSDQGQQKRPSRLTGTIILKCSKLLLSYHQECDGVASKDDSPPPMWQIELDFFDAFVRYGPVEHSTRSIISRFFLPWTYEPQVVKPVSSAFDQKERRGFDALQIEIRFREVVDVLIPFNALKSSCYPNLHVELPLQFQRPNPNLRDGEYMGWVHLKCGNGVPLADLTLHSDISTAEVMRPRMSSPLHCFSPVVRFRS
jgi:hypothetical protein